METFSLRLVSSPKEMEVVQQMADEIWRQHYPSIISEQQIEYMLHKYQSISAIRDQISEGYEYFLIEFEDSDCGYLCIKEDRKDASALLSKIYILEKHRQKGLFRRTLVELEKNLSEKGIKRIWLSVNKNNQSAIQSYLKLGFKKIDEVCNPIGQGFVMDDFIYQLNLTD